MLAPAEYGAYGSWPRSRRVLPLGFIDERPKPAFDNLCLATLADACKTPRGPRPSMDQAATRAPTAPNSKVKDQSACLRSVGEKVVGRDTPAARIPLVP